MALVASPYSLSPWTDSPLSPGPSNVAGATSGAMQTTDTPDALAPKPPQSPYPPIIEPSPVDSQGTASSSHTDIEDEGQTPLSAGPPMMVSPNSPSEALGKLDTTIQSRIRSGSETDPQSVIHAPQNFKKQFDAKATKEPSPTISTKVAPVTSPGSSATLRSPQSPEAMTSLEASAGMDPLPPKVADIQPQTSMTTLNTDVPAVVHEWATPRAQTRQEAEEEYRRRVRHSASLEGIAEVADTTEDQEEHSEATATESVDSEAVKLDQQRRIKELKDTLNMSWNLCNSFSGLSMLHRTKLFRDYVSSDLQVLQESAWETCWKLCQSLYESREAYDESNVLPTLEMCRNFCQALFNARRVVDETSDAVLRVSFELNNHMYNTHDRSLPSLFQERTLDFYLALSHRLMKLQTSLPEETDTLLRACWYLAEVLFDVRKCHRDKRPVEEDLLTAAIQACWDLSNIFRQGWTQTQVHADQGTPKPAQVSFGESHSTLRSRSAMSRRSLASTARSISQPSLRGDHLRPTHFPPETPTTIFDEPNDSDQALEGTQNAPKILVLGPDNRSGSTSGRWSSAASTISDASQHTASTTTVSSRSSLDCIRILLVKAALDAGFKETKATTSSTSSASNATSRMQNAVTQNHALVSFVKALPSDSFGSEDWEVALLDKYRKIILAWPQLAKSPGVARGDGTPLNGGLLWSQRSPKTITAAEAARAVDWMTGRDQYAWLRDLFRLIFGCFPDDAFGMNDVTLQA